jgi:hypothetical protein
MSVPPNAREAWSQLTKMAQSAQRKGGVPGPKGVGAGLGGLVLLGGALFLANNGLFNVDGGHRAIKYTRIGGVKQEIYAEGWCDELDQTTFVAVQCRRRMLTTFIKQVHISRSHGSRHQ